VYKKCEEIALCFPSSFGGAVIYDRGKQLMVLGVTSRCSIPARAYVAPRRFFLSHRIARDQRIHSYESVRSCFHFFLLSTFTILTRDHQKWLKPRHPKTRTVSQRTSWPAVFPLPSRRPPSLPSSASSSSCKYRPRPRRSPPTNNTKVRISVGRCFNAVFRFSVYKRARHDESPPEVHDRCPRENGGGGGGDCSREIDFGVTRLARRAGPPAHTCEINRRSPFFFLVFRLLFGFGFQN